MCDFGLRIPVEAIEEEIGMTPRCYQCECVIREEGVFDGIANYHCVSCAASLSLRILAEAKIYAEKHCKISKTQLPTFDPRKEWKPTSEEYAMGEREANTENALRSCLRHDYTNYDVLLRNLNKDVLQDQVYYSAIRERIDELVEERIDADGLILCENDWESDSDE